MRVLVASGFEARAQWAHAINTVKMAEGFSKLGHDVRIVCRRPKSGPVEDALLAKTYGLESTLAWVQISASRYVRGSMSEWLFALRAVPRIRSYRPDLIFARSYIFPIVTSFLGYDTVVESHAHPDNVTSLDSHRTRSTNGF